MIGPDSYSDPFQPGMSPPAEVSPSQTVLDPTRYFQTANAAARVIIDNADINGRVSELMQQVNQGESTMRRYFSVSYRSFLTKIKNLACPFTVKNWSRSVRDDQPALPVVNPNLPEFYTPLVFLFSALLLSSVYRGVNECFSFEYISYSFIKTCAIIACLVLLAKFVFFVVNMPGSFSIFQLVADLSVFNFYTAVLNLVVFVVPSLRWPAFFYCAIASFFWSIRTLNPKAGLQSVHPSPAHTYSIVVIALLQAIAPFWLAEKQITIEAIARTVSEE